jgi:hypothetical protein
MNNTQDVSDMIFDHEEPASDESTTPEIEPMFQPSTLRRTPSSRGDEYDLCMKNIVDKDDMCLAIVPEYDAGVQSFPDWSILDIKPCYAFGYDFANGDRGGRNRLEETLSGIERVLRDVAKVTVCKRASDGIRIKAHRVEPDGEQTHIMLQVSKIVQVGELSMLMVRAVKRGGDMFVFRDMFDKIKNAIENEPEYDSD